MSEATALTWSRIISGGTVWTETTRAVFWAVSATIAEVPWTPQRANAFRSAWIPAPPPESEPAMVIATGIRERPSIPPRLVARNQGGKGRRS